MTEKDSTVQKKAITEKNENISLGKEYKDNDLKEEEARLFSNKINELPMKKLAEIISFLLEENSNALYIKDKHFIILVKKITFNQMKKILILIDGTED